MTQSLLSARSVQNFRALLQDEKRNALNAIDPLYWFAFALCLPVMRVDLSKFETAIVRQNIKKYRLVFWIALLGGLAVQYGVSIDEHDNVDRLAAAMLAPLIVTGTAWFVISFGGVQQRLLNTAMSLMQWMFAAFVLCLVTIAIAIGQIVSWPLTLAVCVIFGLVIFSAITYDNVDSLKLGLDHTLRRHSLTALYKLHMDEANDGEGGLRRRRSILDRRAPPAKSSADNAAKDRPGSFTGRGNT